MELTALKVAGILGGTATVSAGAYGVYHLSSSAPIETIKSKLETYFKGTNTIFLDPNHPEWSNLNTWYSRVKNKPVKEGSTIALTLDEVKDWCVKKVNEGFKSESDSLYKQVKSLCFLNVNTLLQESGKGKLRSSQPDTHQDWKDAWTSYNADSNKEAKGVKIDDVSVNVQEQVAGGKAMHAWCTSAKVKKMYDSESLFLAFRAWCIN